MMWAIAAVIALAGVIELSWRWRERTTRRVVDHGRMSDQAERREP